MKKLIEKQSTINSIMSMPCKSDEDGYLWVVRSDVLNRIDEQPVVEPEVVRCQDCIHGVGPDHNLRCSKYYGMGEYDGFCSRGYRRTHA